MVRLGALDLFPPHSSCEADGHWLQVSGLALLFGSETKPKTFRAKRTPQLGMPSPNRSLDPPKKESESLASWALSGNCQEVPGYRSHKDRPRTPRCAASGSPVGAVWGSRSWTPKFGGAPIKGSIFPSTSSTSLRSTHLMGGGRRPRRSRLLVSMDPLHARRAGRTGRRLGAAVTGAGV